MVLTQEQQHRLSERLDVLKDFDGVGKVAEEAQVTTKVINKAQAGGNIRVSTIQAIMAALKVVEGQREQALKEVAEDLDAPVTSIPAAA